MLLWFAVAVTILVIAVMSGIVVFSVAWLPSSAEIRKFVALVS